MTAELELLANYACRVGENPLWHPFERRLYWLDIPQGTIFCYEPKSGTHEVFYRGEVTGGFTIQMDGSLLLFSLQGAIRNLHTGETTTFIESIPGEENNRFNDVIADPKGRVLCGTMPFGPKSITGSLYRLDLDGSHTKLLDHVGISNGMGFSVDLKTLYYTDSAKRTIYQFDYDISTGDISNQRTFAVLPDEYGLPDGLTVDAEGFIWSANWDGWQILRYDPQGQIERSISLPVKKVSCLTFGGDDYSDIYVTTAGGDNPTENGESAGALYRLRLGFKGKPEFLSRIRLPD